MNATRVGLWLFVVGLLLFVGAAATAPTGACPAVESANDVVDCAGEPGLELVYGGLGLAAVGGLVWVAGVVATLVIDFST
jgi:hypothetical protein